jgi:hypothetical protein
MAASGVTMQNLPQEELHSGDWREHAVAPPGIADLATGCENRFGLPPRGPLACQALQDGGDVRNPLVTSSMMGALPHRRELKRLNN